MEEQSYSAKEAWNVSKPSGNHWFYFKKRRKPAKYKRSRIVMKCFVYLLFTVGCCYQVGEFLAIFFKYETIVDLQVIYKHTVESPALTICENNPGKRDVYCLIFPENCTAEDPDFCEKHPKICLFYPKSVHHKLKIPLKPISEKSFNSQSKYRALRIEEKSREILLSCIYPTENEKKHCKFDHMFPKFQLREPVRMCHVYNSHNRKPFMVSLTTKKKDARDKFFGQYLITTDIDFDSHQYMDPKGEVGAYFLINSPYEILDPTLYGYYIKPGKSYLFYVDVRERFLMKSPYQTNCKDYMELWNSRGQKGPLSSKSCVLECKINFTLSRCHCIENNLFTYSTDNFCDLNSPCEFPQHEEKKCYQKCGMACYSLEFEVSRTEVREFSNREIGSFENVFRIIPRANKTQTIKQSFSSIHIYFNRPEVLVYNYKPKYEAIEIFSFLGGYIGIWLGLSLYSIYEQIYEIICKFMKSKKKRSSKKTSNNTCTVDVIPLH